MWSCTPQVERDLAWLGLIERTKFEWRGITKLVKEKERKRMKRKKRKGTTIERTKERKWNMEKKEKEARPRAVCEFNGTKNKVK